MQRPYQKVRNLWWWGLGMLWLGDGLLSLQKNMPLDTLDIILMGGWDQPQWLINLLNNGLVYILYQHHWAGWFDGWLAVMQLGLGVALMAGREKPLGYWALRISIPFGLLIWFGGEWAGSLLSLSVSFVTGGPGAALLYVAMAVLLLNVQQWPKPDFLLRIRRGVGITWMIGAAFQAFPVFWTSSGLTSPFQESLVMTPVSIRTAPIVAFIAWSGHNPILANFLLVAACCAFGYALWQGWGGRGFYLIAAAWLLWIWWIGENFGALAGGVSTDPNTAPLWALVLLPGWMIANNRKNGLKSDLPIPP